MTTAWRLRRDGRRRAAHPIDATPFRLATVDDREAAVPRRRGEMRSRAPRQPATLRLIVDPFASDASSSADAVEAGGSDSGPADSGSATQDSESAELGHLLLAPSHFANAASFEGRRGSAFTTRRRRAAPRGGRAETRCRAS